MATTAILPIHAGKGRPVAAALKISVDYIKNPEKTDAGQWLTAYAVYPLIADDEFLFSENQYLSITGRSQGKNDVLAYHLRIAFKPGETDAATANKIGYDRAMKLTKGHHAFVCCTHVDKAHTHTHVVINSTNLDCTGKFRNFKGSSFAIRRVAEVFVPFVITRQTSFTLLIDIQKKINEGKGAAYENWAKLYNLKQATRALIYLKENGIDSYDDLVQKSSSASGSFQNKLTRIKEIETRQKEISELQKQIGVYSKTRATYSAYLRSGRDQAFYNSEATDIILCEAARSHAHEI